MGRTESWMYFWSTLGAAVVICVAEKHFTVQQDPLLFDYALQACQPAGSFLANIANMTEVWEILTAITDTLGQTQTFLGQTHMLSFWIGLKAGRYDCVVGDKPLRGFKWTVEVGSDPEVGRWMKEPQQTCTGIRCALLSVEFNETAVVDWGLMSSSCQKPYPFICKIGEDVVPKVSCPPSITTEARSQRIYSDGTMMVECFNGDILMLNCSIDTHTWILADGSAANGGICPTCDAGFERDESQICVDVDECRKQPELCKDFCINTDGGYLCQCEDHAGNLHDEGSSACNSKLTTTTVHPLVNQINTPTPTATILGKPSPSSPTASPEPSATTTGSSPVVDQQANVFIPVLIAVMSLVVLVVVVLAVVKCCLRRRSQQLAMKKAEKMAMERAEATKEDRINGRDSMECTNEKEAT